MHHSKAKGLVKSSKVNGIIRIPAAATLSRTNPFPPSRPFKYRHSYTITDNIDLSTGPTLPMKVSLNVQTDVFTMTGFKHLSEGLVMGSTYYCYKHINIGFRRNNRGSFMN